MPKPAALTERYLKEDELAITSALEALLQHSHGRKLLWWLLEIGRVGSQPFTPNALSTAFGCGELNVGQQILSRITSVSPEGYLTMMKEQADARRTRDAELADAAGRGTDEPDYDSDRGAPG